MSMWPSGASVLAIVAAMVPVRMLSGQTPADTAGLTAFSRYEAGAHPAGPRAACGGQARAIAALRRVFGT